MDLRALLFLAGCCTLICCGQSTRNHLHLNITDTQAADESPLPIKERFRRLIPYMTFYLDQGYNTQSQYVTQTPQDFQTIQTVNNNLQQQPYFLPPQYQQPKVQLVPLGYLVGGGYRRTPVYSRPTQPDYSQVPYTHQHSTDLTRMVTQNYLSMPKPMNDHTQDQRPAQYTTKLQYTNLNQYQNPLSVPKTKLSQNKVYYQPRHRFYQTANRQPYSLKNYRPSYTNTPPKDDSYTHLHNNYEVNYQSTPKIKNYEPSPEVMTIAKSQEINFSEEESLEPSPIALTLPETTTSNIPQIQTEYEHSTPIQTTEDQNNLLDILTSYQLSKVLPEKVTPSNIGYSIRTLSNILKLLQKAKAQTNEPALDDEGDNYENGVNQNYSPYQTEGSTPGRAGIDYPAYSEIPETHFSCKSQRYKGFFGDPETNCQVWHYCDLNGGQASFLCPNGTIFSQVALTCDWWFNVKCASTAQLYVLNERLYKYILPVKPSFPEDYAGPLVDEYLTLKFQELEAKKENTTTTEKTTSTLQVLLNDEINQAVK